jgi:hypothetical protein
MDLDTVLAAEGPLWDQLYARLTGLSDDELVRPLVDEWSAKDILLHLSRWHDHARDAIQAMTAGREPLSRHDDFNDWNARWNAEDQKCTVDDARRITSESRRALIGCVANLRRQPAAGPATRRMGAVASCQHPGALCPAPERVAGYVLTGSPLPRRFRRCRAAEGERALRTRSCSRRTSICAVTWVPHPQA